MKTFERRKKLTSSSNYGWSEGKAWWDYSHPYYPSGPDKEGWGHFITACIWKFGEGEFMAIAHGCHWEGTERAWSPSWSLQTTLEAAMDFCEVDMVARGTLPQWPEL